MVDILEHAIARAHTCIRRWVGIYLQENVEMCLFQVPRSPDEVPMGQIVVRWIPTIQGYTLRSQEARVGSRGLLQHVWEASCGVVDIPDSFGT